jgi:hypothetical protein
MRFDQLLAVVRDVPSFVALLHEAFSEEEEGRREALLAIAITKGLYYPSLRDLAARFGLVITEGRDNRSAREVRARCMIVLGRHEDAQVLRAEFTTSVALEEAMTHIVTAFELGRRPSVEDVERVLNAVSDSSSAG